MNAKRCSHHSAEWVSCRRTFYCQAAVIWCMRVALRWLLWKNILFDDGDGYGFQNHYTQARSQGGGGRGVGRPPPPVAHPKDFVPPFSNFVPPFSNFVPPFSNFVPPLEYVDDVTRTMSKGGGVPVNVQEWGRFSNWWRHADNVQGGRVRLVFHPSKFRPPPTWLAGYGPDTTYRNSTL